MLWQPGPKRPFGGRPPPGAQRAPKSPFRGILGVFGVWGPLTGEGPTGPAGLLKASLLKASLLKARGFILVFFFFVRAFGPGPSGPRVKGYLGC